ncbi:UNVERIFIED_CONTAM: NADH-cytochrome b5 reductase 3, partial [Eudyptes robustus]
INFRGPTFQHIYHGNGQFSTGHTPANTPDKTRYAHFKRISLIAGGTGITPILQIMNKSLKDPDDKTEFALLFGNQTQ